MTVREELSLDFSQALRGVDTLSSRLQSAADAFRSSIQSALANIDQVKLTADASEITSDIDGAVDAADSNVVVTGEAQELTGDVDGAIDAADSHVVVTGDAQELTGDVDGAIDAADAHVDVTGDATQITGAIDKAVDAADTSIILTANPAGLAAASTAAGGLSTNLAGASAGAGGLTAGLGSVKGAAAGLGVAFGAVEAIQFFNGAIQQASALEEAVNKTGVIFGDAAEQILSFGETAATSVGLAKQEALAAASDFGILLTSADIASDSAANMSERLVRLAADLGSISDTDVPDVLAAIRSGLVGEVEPLRRLTGGFNAAQVEAKAMALGLVDVNGEISEAAKLQARYALILEGGAFANGDWARTADGLANSQRSLNAQWTNFQTQIGEGLLPVMKLLVATGSDVLSAIEPLIGPLSTILGTLLKFRVATDAVLVLARAIGALADSEFVAGIIEGMGDAVSKLAEAADFLLSPIEFLARVIPPLANDFVEWAGDIPGVTGALETLATVLGTVADAFEFAGDAFTASASAAALTDAQIALLPPGMREAAEAAREEAAALDESSESTDRNTESMDRLIETAKSVQESLDEAGRAADAYQTILEGALGIHLSAAEAQLNYGESISGVEQALQAQQAAVGATSLTLGDLQQSVIDSTQSAIGFADAVLRETGDVNAANAVLELHRQRVVDLLTAYGVPQPQIDAFLGRIGLIPGAVAPANAAIGTIPAAVGSAADVALNEALRLLGIGPIAGQAGAGAATAFGAGADTIPTEAGDAASGAAAAITNQSPAVRTAAHDMGIQAGTIFGGVLDAVMVGGARDAVQRAGSTIQSVGSGIQGSASSAGRGVGISFGQGIASGIDSTVSSISAAAADAVNQAEAAARNAADAESPSKLLARLGADMSAGLAEGIEANVPRVEVAMGGAVAAAAGLDGLRFDRGISGLGDRVVGALSGAGGRPVVVVVDGLERAADQSGIHVDDLIGAIERRQRSRSFMSGRS